MSTKADVKLNELQVITALSSERQRRITDNEERAANSDMDGYYAKKLEQMREKVYIPMDTGDLARHTGLTHGKVAGALARLTKRGFVTEHHQRYQRGPRTFTLVSLHAEGERLEKAARQAHLLGEQGLASRRADVTRLTERIAELTAPDGAGHIDVVVLSRIQGQLEKVVSNLESILNKD